MGVLEIAALLITATALFSYANHRWLRMPTTIGVMLIALVLSLGLLGLTELGFETGALAKRLLESVDFDRTVLEGMLGFLLFAGALHVDIDDLLAEKWVVGTLATVGVVLSTFLVGGATWGISAALGLGLPVVYCLLFGALISPTDPIAVLAIMKGAGAPRSLETKVGGESLFNDGVGVVVFLVLLETLSVGAQPSVSHVLEFFAFEAVGGALFGLAAGWACYRLLMSVDNYQVEILLTLALVMGGYTLAHAIHVSGPIAMVVAGLLIGNRGRRLAMSDTTREHLDTFWELVDEILNAALFVLIGLEVLLVPKTPAHLVAGLLAIPVTLLARLAGVAGTLGVLQRGRGFSWGDTWILTWRGLRGGIPVALALSLPRGDARSTVIALAYAVVVFSIVVQGLTIGRVIRRSVA